MTSMKTSRVRKLNKSIKVKETVADRLLQAVIETGVESGQAKGKLVKIAYHVAGVSPQAVYQWYNKGSTPTGELTALICRALGMNLMWVLTGDGDSGNPHFNYDDLKSKDSEEDDIEPKTIEVDESDADVTVLSIREAADLGNVSSLCSRRDALKR